MSTERGYQSSGAEAEPKKILNKKAMFELLREGKFGNTLPTWSLAEFKAYLRDNPFPKSVSIRVMGGGGRAFVPNIHSKEELEKKLQEVRRTVRDENMIMVNEGVEHEEILISGEVMKSHRHYDLTYTQPGSLDNFPRDAKETATGLKAKTILDTHMDSKGIATLEEIFDEYPDSVVEFIILKSPSGTLGSNTLFGEVRNY